MAHTPDPSNEINEDYWYCSKILDVSEITLGRDDGNGNIWEITDSEYEEFEFNGVLPDDVVIMGPPFEICPICGERGTYVARVLVDEGGTSVYHFNTGNVENILSELAVSASPRHKNVFRKIKRKVRKIRDKIFGEVGNVDQTCPNPILEVGVFFDGTLNNRYNTEHRLRNDEKFQKHGTNKVKRKGKTTYEIDYDTSYSNALSNPALLYDLYKDGDKYAEKNCCGSDRRSFKKIYVEGIGSKAEKSDSTYGKGTGLGRTGVVKRVNDALALLWDIIKDQGGPDRLEKVVLDVFGFSRGAAAARHFTNIVCSLDDTMYLEVFSGWHGMNNECLSKKLKIEIRFLGIFDTVASIRYANDNDNFPLRLHLNEAQAKKIYHLTAANEYRENFHLSFNTPGGGDTLELPGAHSDVGGGYSFTGDKAPLSTWKKHRCKNLEEVKAIKDAAKKKDMTRMERIFVNEGWIYTLEPDGGIVHEFTEITKEYSIVDPLNLIKVERYVFEERIVLHRPWVKLGLSRVPLHMMHEAATQVVDGAFLDIPDSGEYAIPDDLKRYVPEIRAGYDKMSRDSRWYVLRNYGHVSMADGKWYDKNWVANSPTPFHTRRTITNKPDKASL